MKYLKMSNGGPISSPSCSASWDLHEVEFFDQHGNQIFVPWTQRKKRRLLTHRYIYIYIYGYIFIDIYIYIHTFFPTCQVRVVRFYQSCSPPPPPHPPPPPRSPDPSDPSGHSRTSTASSRSQWALPDLNRDFQVAVGTAEPQPRVPDPSGHCRTSTASSRSQ